MGSIICVLWAAQILRTPIKYCVKEEVDYLISVCGVLSSTTVWVGQSFRRRELCWILSAYIVFSWKSTTPQYLYPDQEKVLPLPWIWDTGVSAMAKLMSTIHSPLGFHPLSEPGCRISPQLGARNHTALYFQGTLQPSSSAPRFILLWSTAFCLTLKSPFLRMILVFLCAQPSVLWKELHATPSPNVPDYLLLTTYDIR